MNALPRSAAEPFRILRPLAPLVFLAVASCSSATSPNTTSTQNQTELQIKGLVLASGTGDVIQSAVVQVRIVTTGSTGAWATDTVSNGNYTVSPTVPGGCTGRDSVSTEWHLQANGFTRPADSSPRVACTTDQQSLDVYLDSSAARTPQAVAGNLTATRVGAGQEFACAGTADGVYCWGAAIGASALGVDANSLPQPTLVPGSAGLSKLSVGNSTVCALDQDGAAWCWGDNSWGSLGVPDFTLDYPAQAMAVETDLRFTRVAAGGYATCGLTAGGAPYCWGAGPTLGAGDSLLAAGIHPTPARVASDRTFSSPSPRGACTPVGSPRTGARTAGVGTIPASSVSATCRKTSAAGMAVPRSPCLSPAG